MDRWTGKGAEDEIKLGGMERCRNKTGKAGRRKAVQDKQMGGVTEADHYGIKSLITFKNSSVRKLKAVSASVGITVQTCFLYCIPCAK